MDIQELYKTPKWAGIYYFKNTLNNKYYVGQAVMLRKRLLHHLSNYNNDRYDAPLYRAFKKYGFESFEFGILEELKSGYSKDELKAKLDELEIQYIKKFNSYGATGYNQTKGGDAGVLGFKQTEETKQHISNIVTQRALQKEHPQETWIKAKNIETGCEVISISISELSRYFCGDTNKLRASIYRCLSKQQKHCHGYIISYYTEEYPNIKFNSGKYITKITEEAIQDIKNNMSEKDFITKYKVCRKTYYNWKNNI